MMRQGCGFRYPSRRGYRDFFARLIATSRPSSAAARSIACDVATRPNSATSIGSGKAPSVSTFLLCVGDHDHPARGPGHDLLAQERPATALDQGEPGADLVRPVDVEVKLRLIVKRRERHACLARNRSGRLRCRDANYGQPRRDAFTKKRDEERGRRPAAKAEPHSVLDMGKRGLGGAALQFVGHGLFRTDFATPARLARALAATKRRVRLAKAGSAR